MIITLFSKNTDSDDCLREAKNNLTSYASKNGMPNPVTLVYGFLRFFFSMRTAWDSGFGSSIDPGHLCQGAVAVEDVGAKGEAQLFPERVALLVAGEHYQRHLVDTQFPDGLEGPFHQLPAQALALKPRVDGGVVDIGPAAIGAH